MPPTTRARTRTTAAGEESIEETYARIQAAVARHRLHVRMPRLRPRQGGGHTLAALMLVFFYRHVGVVKTIAELKRFLVDHGCHSLNPQPRHLGMQHGFRFLVQNCVHPRHPGAPLKQGSYCLLDLRRAHPSAAALHHRHSSLTDAQFGALRRRFRGRCAVCGSVDGEPHLKNALLRTTIERGHADPRRPLTARNCIPMCRLCNCAYKDRATFNRNGIIVRWNGGGRAGSGRPQK